MDCLLLIQFLLHNLLNKYLFPDYHYILPKFFHEVKNFLIEKEERNKECFWGSLSAARTTFSSGLRLLFNSAVRPCEKVFLAAQSESLKGRRNAKPAPRSNGGNQAEAGPATVVQRDAGAATTH